MTILKKPTGSVWTRQRPQRTKSTPCCLTPRSTCLLNTNYNNNNNNFYNGIQERRDYCNYYRGTVARFKLLDSLGWQPYNPTQSRSLVNFLPEIKYDNLKVPINFTDRALCKANEKRRYFISDQATHWYRSQQSLKEKRLPRSSQKIAYNNFMNEAQGFNIRASQFERISPQFLYLLQKYHSDIHLLEYPHIRKVSPVLNKWNYNYFPINKKTEPIDKCLLKLSKSDIQQICTCENSKKFNVCGLFKRLINQKTQNKEDCCCEKQLKSSNNSKSQYKNQKENRKNLKDSQRKQRTAAVAKNLLSSKSSTGIDESEQRPSKVKFFPRKNKSGTLSRAESSTDKDFVLQQNMERQKSGQDSGNKNIKSVKLLLPLKSILKKPSVGNVKEINKANNTKTQQEQNTSSDVEMQQKSRKSRSFIRRLRTKRIPTPVSSQTLVNLQDSKTLLLELWRKLKYKREVSEECTSTESRGGAEKRVEDKLKRLYAGFDRHTASVTSYDGGGSKPIVSVHELHKASSFDSEASDDEENKNTNIVVYEPARTKQTKTFPQEITKNPNSSRFQQIKAMKMTKNQPPQSSESADEQNVKKVYKYPSPIERNKLRTKEHNSRQPPDQNRKKQNERKNDHHVSRYESYNCNDIRNNTTTKSQPIDKDEIIGSSNEDVDFYEKRYDTNPEFSNSRNQNYNNNNNKTSEQRKETIESSKIRSESKNKWTTNPNSFEIVNTKIIDQSNTSLDEENIKHLNPKSYRHEEYFPISEFAHYNLNQNSQWNEDNDSLTSSNSNDDSISSRTDVFEHQTKDIRKSKGKKRFQKTIKFNADNENRQNSYAENYKIYSESNPNANSKIKTKQHKDINMNHQRNRKYIENYRRLSSGDETMPSRSPNDIKHRRSKQKSIKNSIPIIKSHKNKRRYLSSQKLIDYNTEYSNSENEQNFDTPLYHGNKPLRGYHREYGSSQEFFERNRSRSKSKRRRPVTKSYDLVKMTNYLQQSDNSFIELPNSKPLSSKRKNLKKSPNIIQRYVMPNKKTAQIVNNSKYITTSQYIDTGNERKPTTKNRQIQKKEGKRLKGQLQASSDYLLPEITSSSSRSRLSMVFTEEPRYHKSKNKMRSRYIERRTGGHFSFPPDDQNQTKSHFFKEEIHKTNEISEKNDSRFGNVKGKVTPFKETTNTSTVEETQQNDSSGSFELSESDESEVLIRSEEFNYERENFNQKEFVQVETQSSKESLEKRPVFEQLTTKKGQTAIHQTWRPKRHNIIIKQQVSKKPPILNRKMQQNPKIDTRPQRVIIKQYMSENTSPPPRNNRIHNRQQSPPTNNGENFIDGNRMQSKGGRKRQHSGQRGQKKMPVNKDSTLWRYPSSSKQKLKTVNQIPTQNPEYILGKHKNPPRHNKYMEKRR